MPSTGILHSILDSCWDTPWYKDLIHPIRFSSTCRSDFPVYMRLCWGRVAYSTCLYLLPNSCAALFGKISLFPSTTNSSLSGLG